jgi:xanthine dehydrogenase YagS FAD-binding subunit
MTPFTYSRAVDAVDAIRLASGIRAKYLGGGTNLVDLMRETIERPPALVDVTGLSSAIEEREDGGLLIGAAARNTALAEHSAVRTRYPMLTRAIIAGASAQIRNMATVAGNIRFSFALRGQRHASPIADSARRAACQSSSTSTTQAPWITGTPR